MCLHLHWAWGSRMRIKKPLTRVTPKKSRSSSTEGPPTEEGCRGISPFFQVNAYVLRRVTRSRLKSGLGMMAEHIACSTQGRHMGFTMAVSSPCSVQAHTRLKSIVT